MAGKHGHLKMKREERAKQFAAFKALDGYEEAILDRLRIVEDVRIPNEEEKEELDRAIFSVKPGQMVTALYKEYSDCIRLQGMVSRIDIEAGIIVIVDKKINLTNLLELKIEKID